MKGRGLLAISGLFLLGCAARSNDAHVRGAWQYHEDSVTFAEKALQPAKVSRVTVVDAGEKHLEVVVDDTQLSLAIGKKGQNVRLAAKLLGWKIDIKSEEEKRAEVEKQFGALEIGGAEAAETAQSEEPQAVETSAAEPAAADAVEAAAEPEPVATEEAAKAE